jgi:predicted  nucleic acid-binding Zn-ribbon protein
MVKELHNRMGMLQAAAEEEAKTLRDDITTLTTARAAAEEQAKTLRAKVTAARAAAVEARTLVDHMASEMDMEVEK